MAEAVIYQLPYFAFHNLDKWQTAGETHAPSPDAVGVDFRTVTVHLSAFYKWSQQAFHLPAILKKNKNLLLIEGNLLAYYLVKDSNAPRLL